MTIDYEIRLAAFKWLNEQEIVYGKPGIEGIPEGLKWGNVFKGKKL